MEAEVVRKVEAEGAADIVKLKTRRMMNRFFRSRNNLTGKKAAG